MYGKFQNPLQKRTQMCHVATRRSWWPIGGKDDPSGWADTVKTVPAGPGSGNSNGHRRRERTTTPTARSSTPRLQQRPARASRHLDRCVSRQTNSDHIPEDRLAKRRAIAARNRGRRLAGQLKPALATHWQQGSVSVMFRDYGPSTLQSPLDRYFDRDHYPSRSAFLR